ncbi:tRNA-dependent cyclodipeptide synthase [Austwickia chelonae]|uniref:tRNA-dependent cyclodipeptide synthase n=1 Tax=Austwickia chelonae TaxID=100225 RepID=UPI00068C5A69|nr:tRNA-dependent cyclodipeptide synthase [Austwickia chelonae]
MTEVLLRDVVFRREPLTESCAQIVAEAEHVCVGVSPFNGYFNQARITALVQWAFETYPQASFFVPDKSAAHTLRALGYAEAKAESKARKQGKYVLNKVRTALAQAGVEETPGMVLCHENLSVNPRYLELLQEGRRRYLEEPGFQEATVATSRGILQAWAEEGNPPQENQEEQAVQYFLEELPMFIDTPGIVGVDSSVFVYHREIPYLRRLYDRELSWHPVERQGFALVTVDEDLRGGPAPEV